jgi:hypothetical protein
MVIIAGEAHTLVNLIYGTEDLIPEEKSEAIALAVDIMGFSDDAKADLYSLLEEKLEQDTPYYLALCISKEALVKNKERFPRD